MSTNTDEQTPMTEDEFQALLVKLADGGATVIQQEHLVNLLNDRHRLEAEAEENALRFAWLEWAMKSDLHSDETLKAWIRLEELFVLGGSLTAAIDQLRAERREK